MRDHRAVLGKKAPTCVAAAAVLSAVPPRPGPDGR